jgi:hypothetical protein
MIPFILAALVQGQAADIHEIRCAVEQFEIIRNHHDVTGEWVNLEDGEGRLIQRNAEPVRLIYEGSATAFTLRAHNEGEYPGMLTLELFYDGNAAPVRTIPWPANVHNRTQQAGTAVLLCRRQSFN